MTWQGRAIRRHRLLLVHLTSPVSAEVERGDLSVGAQQRGGKMFVKSKTGWVRVWAKSFWVQVTLLPPLRVSSGEGLQRGREATTQLQDFFGSRSLGSILSS